MQRGVRLFLLRIPPDPKVVHWPQEMISNTLHVVHAVTPVQFDPDTAEELLVASFEGVTLFDRLPNGAWTQRRLCAGEQQTSPNRGSSEVCMGHLAGGTPFIATIEPFHGHEVAVYLPPPDPDALWIRTLLDDTLDAGHAIGAGDFDGDGNDEIVAGYRGRNRDGRKPTSLKLYQPIDPAQGAWKTHWIDTGDMACEDLKVADINGDGKPDIIAAGRSTRNLKVYLNRTVR
jgi:hypothetical protein